MAASKDPIARLGMFGYMAEPFDIRSSRAARTPTIPELCKNCVYGLVGTVRSGEHWSVP
jgi:hypothetical protein